MKNNMTELNDNEVEKLISDSNTGRLKIIHTKFRYHRVYKHGALLGAWRNGTVWDWKGNVWYYNPELC